MTEENNVVNAGSWGPYTTSMTKEEANIRKKVSKIVPGITFEVEANKTKDRRIIGRTTATNEDALKQNAIEVDKHIIIPHKIINIS
jgi:hypothetical protein